MTVEQDFTGFLHREIPITAAQGIAVLRFEGDMLELTAPLLPNINDKGTAFAGSQYSLAVLAGWALLTLQLQRDGRRAQVAVFESRMDYSQPVQGDYQATARFAADADGADYYQQLSAKGRGRIEVSVLLSDSAGVAATFHGKYAVKLMD